MDFTDIDLDLIADDVEMTAEWRIQNRMYALEDQGLAAVALTQLASDIRNMPDPHVRAQLVSCAYDTITARGVSVLNREIGFSRPVPSAAEYLLELLAVRATGCQ